MKSEQVKIKEIVDLVFEQNEYLEIYNTYNRYAPEWIRPVNKEIVDTLLLASKMKVTYTDNDGELYLNF